MKRTTFSNHINALSSEVLLILRFQLAYNRISEFKNIKQIGRSDFVDKLISLKAIENDLTIRLCKFNDNRKDVHSFKNAIKEMPNNHHNKTEISKKNKLLSSLTEELIKNRRNTKLAHLKIGEIDGEYDLKYNFIPIISLIVEIIDLMAETEKKYLWKDGSYEKFDLRKIILNPN